jgi:hypothetical protein
MDKRGLMELRAEEDLTGQEFWDTFNTEFREMIIGLKNQHPYLTFEMVQDCLLGILLQHQQRILGVSKDE